MELALQKQNSIARQQQSQTQSNLENLNLQPQEKKILELKYQSQPFGKMDPLQLKVAASALLLKISFITGWSLYEDPANHGQFKEQFELKITESYPNVNVDEMLYAFRQNTTVKDWGNHMNLSLIDEVMIPYLDQRKLISDLEENLSKPKMIEGPVEEISDEDFLSSNKFVYTTTRKFNLISTRCYDILINQGKITRPEGEERERIMKTARSNFFSLENKEYTTVLRHEEIERFIMQDCKKICVCEYWNNEK